MAAESQDTPVAPQPAMDLDQPTFTDAKPRGDYEPLFLGRQKSSGVSDPIVRFGWWGTQNRGADTKTGEYQSLDSSPFWDLDGLSSDGTRSANFFATGTDNDATHAGLNYFGPRVSTDVYYDRYLRRLDFDPLDNLSNNLFPSQPTFNGVNGPLVNPGNLNRAFMHQDLNVGEDYAIRVQEFSAKFKGNVTENIKWRLNLWGMRKQGERQATSMSHCFNGDTVDTGTATDPPVPAGARACHVLSQRQRIDWLTTEIEPVLEGRWGPVSVEYSRVIRGFDQDDQLVSRNHTTNNIERSIGAPGDGAVDQDPANAGTVVGYAVVPESVFEMDRLKIGVDLTETTDFYAHLFYGNTHNRNRLTNRQTSGFDLRLTDHSIDGVSVTGYAKKFYDRNQDAPFVATDGTEVIPVGPDAGTTRLEHPWDREKTSTGIKGRWRLFGDGPHAIVSGYDYTIIDRDFTEHHTERPEQLFTQPTTVYHTLNVGLNSRWSPVFDTFVRYKRQWIARPMFASHEPNGVTNSSLPTDVDLVQFGGTWVPADYFLLTTWIGLESSSHSSNRADFDEDTYPISVSAWYAPTSRWSLSAGYAHFSNWIDQDITLGDQVDRWSGTAPSSRHQLEAATTRWSYGGEANMISLGTRYDCTGGLVLVGGLEYVRSHDRFVSPSPPAYDLTTGVPSFPVAPDWSELPDLSEVLVETWRWTAGVDYLLSDRSSVYFRYVYFDYQDKSKPFNTGTSNFFLGGFTAVF